MDDYPHSVAVGEIWVTDNEGSASTSVPTNCT